MTDRRVLGKRSRRKGHDFERLIVRKIKERFSDCSWASGVRRSDQSHRAALSDVTGWPGVWVECQTAASPNPAAKLRQALHDVGAAGDIGQSVIVAVTRRKGSPVIEATLRLADLFYLSIGGEQRCRGLPATLATINFDALLELYSRSHLYFRANAK